MLGSSNVGIWIQTSNKKKIEAIIKKMALLRECVINCTNSKFWRSTTNGVYITFNYKYDINEIYKIYIQKNKTKKTKDKMK